MLRKMANRAPFKGAQRQHPDNLNLTQAVLDRDFIVVRWCGRSVDVDAMAEEMNTRAALTIMTEGTGADADWRRADAWKEHP